MTIELVQALGSFGGGVIVAVLTSWLAFRRWSKSALHDKTRDHLVWRYQKQLSSYREFFELSREVTSDDAYVRRIENRYKNTYERQQSAERHAMRRAAPFLAEFGFVFGGTLSVQAARLLQAAARSRLTPVETASDARAGMSVLPPQRNELDDELNSFQKGVIATIATVEQLLGVPPRVAAETVPTVNVGKAFTFTMTEERGVSPAPEPLPVPRHSELPP